MKCQSHPFAWVHDFFKVWRYISHNVRCHNTSHHTCYIMSGFCSVHAIIIKFVEIRNSLIATHCWIEPTNTSSSLLKDPISIKQRSWSPDMASSHSLRMTIDCYSVHRSVNCGGTHITGVLRVHNYQDISCTNHSLVDWPACFRPSRLPWQESNPGRLRGSYNGYPIHHPVCACHTDC